MRLGTDPTIAQLFGTPRKPFKEIMRALLRQPAGVIGLLVVATYVVIAFGAPIIAPHDPLATDPLNSLAGPSSDHLLGTDEIGRDVLSRLLHATGPALLVGSIAVLLGGVVGTTLGIVAGYRRGALESGIMRVCDVVFAFPAVLVGIFAVVVLGPGVVPVAMAVGIASVPMFARLARAEVLEEMSHDFVRASRGMGATDRFVVVRHVLPNISTTLLVQAAAAVSAAVVLATALDFLGLGTQPPNPSWGAMLQSSRLYLPVAPVYAIAPGVVITVFVLSINLLAAALTNALDPRIRTKLLKAGSAGPFALLFGGVRSRFGGAPRPEGLVQS